MTAEKSLTLGNWFYQNHIKFEVEWKAVEYI